MYDLSILIPARNEIFLSQTLNNILENIEGKTEIIITLDGAWSDPPIVDDPRVTIIYHNQSVGQRKATNEACKLSNAKWVMKVDAHCAFDKGFDVKMMKDMEGHDDWTMIPTLYNLHAFNWKCKKCGNEWYQGPTPTHCQLPGEKKGENSDCDGSSFEKFIIWKPRLSRKSHFYRFDTTLHFQYHGGRRNDPSASGDIVETMSAQGSCFMLTRERYWELNICDEEYGSWGQQGTEVACKTWLSGGRLVTSKNTWYAHMFRTQGLDFGFPYPISGNQVDHARKYSKEQFLENKWPRQVYPLSWLIEKFKPLPDWHDESGKEVYDKVMKAGEEFYKSKKIHIKPTKGIVYYSHNVTDSPVFKAVQKQILKGMKEKHIVSVTNIPCNFGKNVVFPRVAQEIGFIDLFERVLLGLEASDADVIFIAEHDVLYHPSHYDFLPERKDVYYYNENVWHLRLSDGHALYHDHNKLLSHMVGDRLFLIEHYKRRLAKIYREGFTRKQGFEPGTHHRPERVDDFKAEAYKSKFPNLDIRTGVNSTESKWKKEDFRNKKFTEGWRESDTGIEGWGTREEILQLIT